MQMKKFLLLLIMFLPLQPLYALERVGDFALLDHKGDFHQIGRYDHRQAVVLLSEGANCSSFNGALTQFNIVNAKYSDSFEFMLLNSTGVQDRSVVQAQAASYGVSLPLLMDESQLVPELLGVDNIGEVVVVDPNRFEVLYRGSVANLDRALGQISSGAAVSNADSAVPDCSINYAAKELHDRVPISYSADIAPMLEENCANCHREKGIGPFAMDSHLMIQGWAPMIKEVLMTKRMPPGQIDPHIGNVKVQRHLSAENIQKLVHWIDAGAARDSQADPLAAIDWPDTKWPLGEPDVLVKIPPQEVPATGVMQYTWVDSGYATDRDRWVKGADLIPGDRSVVHHILARAIPPGAAGPKIGICPTPCEQGQGDQSLSMEERGISLPAYIPGNNARFLDENTGQFVPAGSRMVFQMHYTTSGRATVDASEFGLYFYEDGFEPTEKIDSGGVLANDFLIPPNDGDFEVVRTRTIPKDAYVISFYPHMHLRGKRMKWTAEYPDGRTEKLLSVPNYDFNWQMTYELEQPKFIPAGTKIIVEGAFDNSTMNPNNPDPTASITWGDQSYEEMFIGNMAIKYAGGEAFD